MVTALVKWPTLQMRKLMHREVKYLAQSHVASKRRLALEPRQPGYRAPFFTSSLSNKLVSMLDTSVCPSRSTLHHSPPTRCCRLYLRAPLPFQLSVGFSQWVSQAGDQKKGEACGRPVGGMSPPGWLRPLTHGHISWQLTNHTGPICGFWCSHLSLTLQAQGWSSSCYLLYYFCGFPTSCPHLCKQPLKLSSNYPI